MRFLFLPMLFLMLTFTSILSAQTDNIIVVGAFYTQDQADRRLAKLEEAMESQRHIVSLQKDLGFDYHTKKSGKFYIVTVSPFKNKSDLLSVLSTVHMIYPDAYAHKVRPSVSKAEPAVQEERPFAEQTQQREVQKVEVTEEPEVPELPVEAVVPETVEVVAVEEVVKEVVIETEVTEPAAEEAHSSNLLLYGAAAAVVLLLLLVAVLKGRKKEEPEQPELQDIQVETPVDIPSPVHEEVTERIPEVQLEPEVAETAAEEVPPVEEEVPVSKPAPVGEVVSTRKKREPVTHTETITKDNLSEFAGNRILVAEDNMINQKVITKLMEGSGIKIVIANDGQEAMDFLEHDSNFQMVLMDAHMPRKDGFEATREIRANPDYDHITVVALSGDISSDDIRKMKEAGMEEQLAKPLRIDKLYDVLYAYCDLQSEKEVSQPNRQILDVEEGLYISGDHMDLYKEVLDEFAEEYGESAQLLENYLAQHNDELLGMLLLDIRGIAANIGADVLSDTAEELREAVLDKRTEEYEALSIQYRKDLEALLAAIKILPLEQ